METKSKINSILEKKLEELESLLETTTNDFDPNLYRQIQLRIVFASTLLAAEISSRSIHVEGEEDDEETLKFACMAKRLKELEEVFKNDSLIEPECGSVETDVGNTETGSVYSLVESCPNESIKAEEEKEKELEAEEWPLFQDALSEEKREVTFPVVSTVKKVSVVIEVKEKRWIGFRTLICFGLIGLGCGMVSFLGYIPVNMQEDIFFPTPT